MKRYLLLSVVLGIASMLFAQTVPSGATVRVGDGTWYLNVTNYTWGNRADNYPDTLAIGSGKWTAVFKSPEGHMNQEGVAILTAATDSFKIVLCGSNSQNSDVTMDTTMLTRIDSVKVLTAGLYTKVWAVSGKWKPWLVEEYVPLNPGATITGKSRRNSLSIQ